MIHVFTRSYLSIELGVKLSYESLKKPKTNLTKYPKSIEHSTLLTQIPPNLQYDQSNKRIMDQGPAYPPSEYRVDAPTQDPITDPPPDPVEIDLVIDIDTAKGNEYFEGEVDRAVDDNSHLYTKICISELCLLRNDANIGRKMQKNYTKKSCSPLGQRLIGIAMMHAPKLTLESA